MSVEKLNELIATIDELIAKCKKEFTRAERVKVRSEYDYGYMVAYGQCLELAKKVKLTILENLLKEQKND